MSLSWRELTALSERLVGVALRLISPVVLNLVFFANLLTDERSAIPRGAVWAFFLPSVFPG